LISSSGESDNIIAAAEQSKKMGLTLLTFSGFLASNRLAKYGNVRFWCDSNLYNTIENTHQIWLLAIIDFYIENKE
jgi:phosphoheptose isomerase